MIMTCIGIDNGMSGALCAVSHTGSLISWIAMPTQRVNGVNEANVCWITAWLLDNNFTPQNSIACCEMPVGSKSANAAKSMAGCFHALRGYFEGKGYSFDRVRASEWHKRQFGKTKGDMKKLALDKAKRLWPKERWLRSYRCSKPHDGAIDAALIANDWHFQNLKELERRAGSCFFK